MLHPYAASSKATRNPPMYPRERTEQMRSSSPPQPPSSSPMYDFGMEEEDPPPMSLDMTGPDVTMQDFFDDDYASVGDTDEKTAVPDEHDRVVESALNSAFDANALTIELSNKGLTHIPPMIADIGHYVALPKGLSDGASKQAFIRTPSLPASSGHFSRTMQRSTTLSSFGTEPAPSERRYNGQELALYLMNNSIEKIPVEACGIEKLAVLSLRANKLTTLPDCIGLLTHLKELNIAGNAITFLPASILKLSLRSFNLHPNPFLPAPQNLTPDGFGPIIEKDAPTLKELCIRRLVSPRPLPPLLGFSLPIDQVAPHLAASLHLSLAPSARYHERNADANLKPMQCPNPMHASRDGGEVWFVEAGEERMQWRTEIAGQKVFGDDGRGIPVLWKGCSAGCLAFLEQDH